MAFKLLCCDDQSGETVGVVLKFESVTLLLDPGWNGKTKYEDAIKYWATIISEIDVIVLSQPTVECLGAFAMLYYNFLPHFISRIEVYSTLPIANLGRVITIDHYATQQVIGPVEGNKMDYQDIEKSFDFIKTVKFSQLIDLKYKFDGLSLIAYNSGSTPGGSIWLINTYTDKLIYAKRWNHTRGAILDSAQLLDSSGKPLTTLLKPSAVITTIDKFGSTKPFKRRNREFKDILKKYLHDNHSIVLPVEISSKFLDIFVNIHDLIYTSAKSRQPINVPVLLVSYSRGRSLTYAKSMFEWLSSTLLKTWETRDNISPFSLNKKFHIIQPEELSKYSGRKICLVSNVDNLFNETILKLYKTEKLHVILTQLINSPTETTSDKDNKQNLLSQLYSKWASDDSNKDGDTITMSDTVNVSTWSKEPLKGKPLSEFQEFVKNRRQEHLEKEETLKKERNLANKTSDSIPTLNDNEANTESNIGNNNESSDDEDDILRSKLRNGGMDNKNFEIPMDIQILGNGNNRMFPFNPKRDKIDDYGKIMDFTMLIPKDEDEDVDKALPDTSKKRKINGKMSKTENDVDGVEDEDDEEDEDAYIITDIPIKKSRRNTQRNKDQTNLENFDNIEYLDTLNHPYKITSVDKNITLRIALTFINLENLVDQRSASLILPTLKPRKLVLLAPKSYQNINMLTTLKNKKLDILCSTFNEEIQLDTAIKTLDISIDLQLDQLLNWQKIGDEHTVAHVIGRLTVENTNGNHNEKEKHFTHRKKMVLRPLEKPSMAYTSGTISIGDVRLVELKRKLTEQNHLAEFKGEGTLVVDNCLAIQKINDSETIIDGSPGPLFETVRSLVAEMLAKI